MEKLTIRSGKPIELDFGDKDCIIFDLKNEISASKGLYVLDADNGVGKSTLLSILSLIHAPVIEEDTIVFSTETDYDYKYLYSPQGLKEQIRIRMEEMVIITQEPFMLPLTIGDNMRILGLGEKEIDTIMNLIHNKFPSLSASSKITSLSGGQMQRVFIEMMFGRIKPDRNHVIFIDEPFNNLSDDNKEILLDKIKKFAEDNLVIMIDHSIPHNCLEKYTASSTDITAKRKHIPENNKLNSDETEKAGKNIWMKFIHIKDNSIGSFIDNYKTELQR
jgi:ABC-type lipoprotein export system ATPase subunit